MDTQKKYHDLVILDDDNGLNETDPKKITSAILLLLSGIFIGALLVSLLNLKQEERSNPRLSPLTSNAPSTIKLQSITTETEGSSGCGIESLGRNAEQEQGCSADAFSQTSLNEMVQEETNLSELNKNIKEGSLLSNDVKVQTNISDLK